MFSRRSLLQMTTGLIAVAAIGSTGFAQSGASNHRVQLDPADFFSRQFPALAGGRREFSADDIAAIGKADLYDDSARAANVQAFWRHLDAATNPEKSESYVVPAAAATLSNSESVGHIAALLKSPSRQVAQEHAISLLKTENATFAADTLAPVALMLVTMGMDKNSVSGLFRSEFGGLVTLQFSADYAPGQVANISAEKSTGGAIAVSIAPAGNQPGNEPVPGPSTQGFFSSLWDFVRGVANFYLDLLWNMFMGAAAGAGLLGAVTMNPFAAAMGGVAGAGAGFWYTIGKTVFGGGGVWLGPDPQNPDTLCGSPPFILC